jgi:predicted dehydrogenase
MITVSILGAGARGESYLKDTLRTKKAQVVAICDIVKERAEKLRNIAKLPKSARYVSDEAFFMAGKLSDVLYICTNDIDHYRHAMEAIKLGYHILLEKPVSSNLNECLEIEKAAREKGLKVVVCHVLRYSNFYRRIKSIIASGEIGEIVNINMTENIGYWHYAHSYVRGNWKKESESSSMLLAKCCHDFDMLYWLTGSIAKSVTSHGGLKFFNKENAPEYAVDHCKKCTAMKTCPYSAYRLYFKGYRIGNPRKSLIRYNNFLYKFVPSFRIATNKHLASRYGRCVWLNDNDVCDHQITALLYENGVKAVHTVTAFSKDCFRSINVYGTKGSIYGADLQDSLILEVFGKPDTEIKASIKGGHLGGDRGMIDTFISYIAGGKEADISFIDTAIESHAVVIAAEKSRLSGGKTVEK